MDEFYDYFDDLDPDYDYYALEKEIADEARYLRELKSKRAKRRRSTFNKKKRMLNIAHNLAHSYMGPYQRIDRKTGEVEPFVRNPGRGNASRFIRKRCNKSVRRTPLYVPEKVTHFTIEKYDPQLGVYTKEIWIPKGSEEYDPCLGNGGNYRKVHNYWNELY